MVNYKQTTVRQNTIINISNGYMPPDNLGDKKVTMAFALTDISAYNLMDNPKFGKFVLKQHSIMTNYYENGTSYTSNTFIEIPY